ncbi:MFS general substrate transporter, partial [Meira miltonrushii]
WTAFTVSFLISFADALDFYTMCYSMHKIADYYNTSKANMSQAITYSILQRTLGGLFSASFGSSFGQKYMVMLDMVMLGSLQVAATFCKNVNLFLIIRALFGLGMSSLFSLAILHLIKNSPQAKRTFIGATFQCSTPLAAILAAGLNIIFHEQDDSWRKMFWVSASVSYFCVIVRFIIPEYKTLQAQEVVSQPETESRQDWRARMRTARDNTIKKPWYQIKTMLQMHWRIFTYSAILMCLSTWYSHAINDTYVTFLIFGKHNRNRTANVILMIIKSTSVPGIVMSGALGQLFGIRRVVIPLGIIAMGLIPAALLPYSRWGLALGGAFLNFFTEAFLALFPAYIGRNAPSQFSIILPAMAYQLGACISSPSSQLVNVFGQNLYFHRKGQRIPAYQYVILTTALITI